MRLSLLFITLLIVPFALQSQKVGIGTVTPAARLDISLAGDGAELLRFSTDRPWMFKQRGSGILARLSLQSVNNDKIFEILSSNGLNRAAEFYSNDTYSRVMLVPDGGEVGIGVDDAAAKLEIRTNSTLGFAQLKLTEEGTDFSRIKMESTDFPGSYWDIAGLATNVAANSRLNFFFNNGTTAGDRLTIRGDGNVGIGQPTPTAKLHVNGKLKIGDDTQVATSGTIRWNTQTQDFEGFNGTDWISLTHGKVSTSWPEVDRTGSGKLLEYQKIALPFPETPTSFIISDDLAMSTTHAVVGYPGQRKAVVLFFNGTIWNIQQIISPSESANAGNFVNSV
jgi:hypothetical protein